MFTLDAIEQAASKVATGADFPQFAKALKAMGVRRNDVYVMNGMAIYFGEGEESIESGPAYENLLIEEESDKEALQQALKTHQQGQSDYQTFCRQAASAGVEKWIIDLNVGTVTYLDMSGKELVTEEIAL